MKEIENVVEINHKELKEVIKRSYELKQSTMIIGRTGIGKSYTVREACKEIAKENNLIFTEDESHINDPKYFILIDRRLSMMEASDIQGIPFVFAVIEDKQNDNYLSTIPIQNINMLATERNRYNVLGYKTLWVKPSFLPLKGNGMIFLDEITLAPPLLQSCAYSLIYDRKVADYTLPDNYLVMGASNVEEDQAYTHTMAGPLRNRFAWYKLAIPDVEEYTMWATQSKPDEYLPIDPRIIAYLNKGGKKNLFNFDRNSKDKAFPTPRSWWYVSKLIKGIKNNRMLRILVSGAIGSGEAHKFLAFLNLEHKLKPISEYFKNPETIELPEDMSLKYFLIGGITDYYSRKLNEYKNKESKQVDLLERYVKLINRLEPEFSVLCVKMTRGVDPELRDKLYNLKGVDPLIERLSKYFT